MIKKYNSLFLIKDRHGITLIELLIGIALLSLVLSVGYTVFSFSYNAYGSGERNFAVRQSTSLVTDFITRELRGATHVQIFPLVVNPDNNDDYFNFNDDGSIILPEDEHGNPRLPSIFKDEDGDGDGESSDNYGFFYINIYEDGDGKEHRVLYHKPPDRGGIGEPVFLNLVKGINTNVEFVLNDSGFLAYSIFEDIEDTKTGDGYKIKSGLQFLNYQFGRFDAPPGPGLAIAYTTKRSLGWNTVVTDLWYMDLLANEGLGEDHEDYCEEMANTKEAFDLERNEADLPPYEETIRTIIWNDMLNDPEFRIIPFIESNSIHITGSQERRGAYFGIDINRYVKDNNSYTIRFDTRLRRGEGYHTQGWGIVLNANYSESSGDAGYMFQFDPGAKGFVVRRNNYGTHYASIADMGVFEDSSPNSGIDATYRPSKINNDRFDWSGEDDNTNPKWLEDYTTQLTVQKQLDGSLILRAKIWETARGRENKAENMWFGDFGEMIYGDLTFKGQPVDDITGISSNKSLYEFPNSKDGSYLGFRSWGGNYYAEFNNLLLTDGFDPLRIKEAKFRVYEDSDNDNEKSSDTIEVTFEDKIRGRDNDCNLFETLSLVSVNVGGSDREIYDWNIINDNQTLEIILFDIIPEDLLPDDENAHTQDNVTVRRGGVRHIHAGDVNISNGSNFDIVGYELTDVRPLAKGLSIRPDILEDATIYEEYNHTFAALGGAEPYTYSAEGLPDGLTLDEDTGELSGSTQIANARADFTLRVIDDDNNEASHEFAFKVDLGDDWHWYLDSGSVELIENNGEEVIQQTSPTTSIEVHGNTRWERGWLTSKDKYEPEVIEFQWYSDRTHSTWSDMRIKFLANGLLNTWGVWSQTGYQIQWEVWQSEPSLVLYELNNSSSEELGRSELLLSEANKWHTMKIEITDDDIKVYHNDLETPIIESDNSKYRDDGYFIFGQREQGGRVLYKDLRIDGEEINWKP